MQKSTFEAKDKQFIENYLKTYSLNRKLWGIEKYMEEYCRRPDSYLDSLDRDMLNEAPIARAKMFSVRHFILELPNCDEKLFLYYHYIKGESTERCAELLGISRRSAFRMRNRALELAYNKYTQREESP